MKTINLYKGSIGLYTYTAEDYYCAAEFFEEASKILEEIAYSYGVYLYNVELVSNNFIIKDDTETTKSEDSEA